VAMGIKSGNGKSGNDTTTENMKMNMNMKMIMLSDSGEKTEWTIFTYQNDSGDL